MTGYDKAVMKSDKYQRIRYLFKPRHESKNHLSLDSTMSLSQPGENDVNGQAQAQALVQIA